MGCSEAHAGVTDLSDLRWAPTPPAWLGIPESTRMKKSGRSRHGSATGQVSCPPRGGCEDMGENLGSSGMKLSPSCRPHPI